MGSCDPSIPTHHAWLSQLKGPFGTEATSVKLRFLLSSVKKQAGLCPSSLLIPSPSLPRPHPRKLTLLCVTPQILPVSVPCGPHCPQNKGQVHRNIMVGKGYGLEHKRFDIGGFYQEKE